MREAPKESFVVGYERQGGSLELYFDLHRTPVIFDTYSRALEVADQLERQVIPYHSPLTTAKTGWQVYRMRFEVVGSVPF